jgi:hypothetical protein
MNAGRLRAAIIGQAAPHRFLPSPKGGFYRWYHVQHCADVILVEGLFDLAALWQAGFRNVTCSLGKNQANVVIAYAEFPSTQIGPIPLR